MATHGSFFTQQFPTGLMIAQTVGITASLFLLGSNIALSVISIPAVLQAPAPLAVQQWYTVFTRGGALARPLAMISAIATGYVAYNQDPTSTPFKLNIAATILLPSIVPFTFAFIVPVNDKLVAKKDKPASASLINKDETVHVLINKWATLNLVRAALVAAGALCAVLASVSKRETIGFREIGLASGANRMG